MFYGLRRVKFHKISNKKYFLLSNGLKKILKFSGSYFMKRRG